MDVARTAPVFPTRSPLSRYLVLLFCAALAVHLFLATRNWHSRFMVGHEFRQTQTALIAYYIDKENNFSVDYSVPILGKPWVLPLEFPLYEWSVVWLSRATALPQHEAARAISLACFYLTLPALYLLLGQLGLDRARRLFVLACTLLCPVYIFYARAVLIDPMALMFSVWFLAAFTRLLREQRWPWLPVVVLCGTAAGLIKSLVWFVWVLPAFAYGAWRLWRDWRQGRLRSAGLTAMWGLGAMIVPIALALWWSRYTDAIKAVHSSAYVFTSYNLARDNYGTFSLSVRLDPGTWRSLLDCWRQSLLPPWSFALIIVSGLILLPAWRRRIAGATGIFLAAQLLIPLAYAYQDYYFYAANLFAVAAVAFVFLGLLDTRPPRAAAAILLLLPLAAFLATYRADYGKLQAVRSNGGSPLTELLRNLTDPDEVLVAAGHDWSPIIPYYTQRRALMIRRDMDKVPGYLERAFGDLRDEQVAALLLTGDQRANTALLALAERLLGIDPRPALDYEETTVYLHRDIIAEHATDALRGTDYEGIRWRERLEPTGSKTALDGREIDTATLQGRDRLLFSRMKPRPHRFFSQFPTGRVPRGKNRILSAHPRTAFWFQAPPAAHTFAFTFGIWENVYADPGRATDGVEFRLSEVRPDGTRRQLFSRTLDPLHQLADRGELQACVPLPSGCSGELLLETLPGPNDSYSFDWAFLGSVSVD
jgi:hypothetical protein